MEKRINSHMTRMSPTTRTARKNFGISLTELVSTLSDAVDLISPVLNNHHKQVAYISYMLAKELGYSNNKLADLMMAALLHDIGALRLDERIELLEFEEKNPFRHTVSAYLLLKDVEIFKRAGEIIRFHHLDWDRGAGVEYKGDPVPLESHIIYVADRAAVSIAASAEILNQAPSIMGKIKMRSGSKFHPLFVETLESLAAREAFWLDLVSPDIGGRLKVLWSDFDKTLNLQELLKVTGVLARVIDFRSRFTAVHSSGVAAVAEVIARKMGWPKRECAKIAIAGHLHDLGKLAVPNRILEKPDRLTVEEYNIIKTHTYYSYYLIDKIRGLEEINRYASFHHETTDGRGYPFRIGGTDLKEGSRIMAVADVFTAVTEKRPYRDGMSEKRAMETIENLALDAKLDAEIVSMVKENAGEINATRKKAQQKAAGEYGFFHQMVEQQEKNLS